MKKYLFLVLSLTLLASCEAQKQSTPVVQNTGAISANTPSSTTVSNGVVQTGSKISVAYTGTLEDGSVFDASSKHGTPLDFTVGTDPMIPGFTAWVMGMKVGEKKTLTIAPKDAYGERDPKKTEKVEKSKLKDFVDHGIKLEKGAKLPTQMGMVSIIDTDEKTVTVDTNHELAGKTLKFEVEIIAIK